MSGYDILDSYPFKRTKRHCRYCRLFSVIQDARVAEQLNINYKIFTLQEMIKHFLPVKRQWRPRH